MGNKFVKTKIYPNFVSSFFVVVYRGFSFTLDCNFGEEAEDLPDTIKSKKLFIVSNGV